MDVKCGVCHLAQNRFLIDNFFISRSSVSFIGCTHSRHPGNPHGCKPITTSCSCKKKAKTHELIQSGKPDWVPGLTQAVVRVVKASTVMGEHGVRVQETRTVSPWPKQSRAQTVHTHSPRTTQRRNLMSWDSTQAARGMRTPEGFCRLDVLGEVGFWQAWNKGKVSTGTMAELDCEENWAELNWTDGRECGSREEARLLWLPGHQPVEENEIASCPYPIKPIHQEFILNILKAY